MNSDLDIIVVTTDNYIPSTNREKMELHHKYNLLIKKFRRAIPIDMLVYTKSMYQKLQETGGIFTAEINRKECHRKIENPVRIYRGVDAERT